MSQQTKTAGITYTVRLPSGCEFDHDYYVPADVEKASKFIHEMTEMMRKALTKEESAPLIFQHPVAVYNPDNVSGIRYTFSPPKELEEFAKQLDRKMGFVKD